MDPMMKLVVTLLLLLLPALPACGAQSANTSGPWGIEAGGFKNLSTALASPLTAGKTVVVSNPMAINNKTTDRTIRVIHGGQINVASGKTLVVNGSIEAGLYRIFAGSGSVTKLKEARPEWWGISSNSASNTVSMNSAILAADTVLLSTRTYEVDTINIRSGLSIKGGGSLTVLHQNSGFILAGNSGSSTDFIENVSIEGVQFKGDVATLGFSEFIHLVAVSGVKNLDIRKCGFIGFRGDGLYLGSDGGERHNLNVKVTGCTFDGVNGDNRNGISIIDSDGLVIFDNDFVNCTRSNMPGAVDIEPNSSYNVLKNITVDLNRFKNVGGSAGIIGLVIQPALVTEFYNFKLTNNNIKDCPNADAFALKSYKSGFSYSNKITITGNLVDNVGNVINPGGNSFRGIIFSYNQVTNYHGNIAFQFNLNADGYIYDVIVSNNLFVAASDGIGGDGIKFTNCENVVIDGNTIANTLAYAISIGFNGLSTKNITIINNTISGTPTFAVNHVTTTYNEHTNVFYGNKLNGRPYVFKALTGDSPALPWTPVAVGLTQTGGSATLTGVYKRIGTKVFVDIVIVPVTSTASVKLTTYFTGMPYTQASPGVVYATSGAVDSLGIGTIISGRFYAPAWTANTNTIYLSGYFETSNAP
jgi:hypothetical protein